MKQQASLICSAGFCFPKILCKYLWNAWELIQCRKRRTSAELFVANRKNIGAFVAVAHEKAINL